MNDPEDDSPDAFVQDGKMIFGERLFPLSFWRWSILQLFSTQELSPNEWAACVIYCCLKTEDELESLRGDGLISGAKARAKARGEMAKWADSHGIRPSSKNEKLFYKVANELWSAFENNEFELDAGKGSGTGGRDPNAIG